MAVGVLQHELGLVHDRARALADADVLGVVPRLAAIGVGAGVFLVGGKNGQLLQLVFQTGFADTADDITLLEEVEVPTPTVLSAGLAGSETSFAEPKPMSRYCEIKSVEMTVADARLGMAIIASAAKRYTPTFPRSNLKAYSLRINQDSRVAKCFTLASYQRGAADAGATTRDMPQATAAAMINFRLLNIGLPPIASNTDYLCSP